MRKQIFKVLHILNKCSINPEENLMTLAETSPEIEYRDFVVEQLQKLAKVKLQLTLLDHLSIIAVTWDITRIKIISQKSLINL